MSDKELRIRVDASMDASLATVFSQAVATAKAAQKAMQASAAQAAKATAASHKGAGKEVEAELVAVGKTAKEQADAMAKDVARSAKERVRAEKDGMREVERDLARHMKEQEKLRAQSERRSGGGGGGGGRGSGRVNSGTFLGAETNRTPIKNDSLLLRGAGAAFGAGKRFAGDALRGVGVETSLAGRLQGSVEREALAGKISSGAWIPGGAGGKAAMTKVDPKTIAAEAMKVGSETGTDAKDILEGMDKFVGLTGDLESARTSMGGLAVLAKANNTEFADMMKGAATVSSSMGDIPDKGKAIVDVMRAIAGQGQLGALTMEEQAKYIGMISAQANNFKIDKTSAATLKGAGVESETGQRIAVVNAMAQYARMKGGRITAKTADQSAMSFVADMTNPKERKNLAAMGIETFTDKSHTTLSDPNALMMEIFKRAKVKGGLDKTVLRAAIPNQKSTAVINSIAQDYQSTYDQTSGTDAEKHQAAIQQVTKTFQDMLGSTQQTDQIMKNFGEHMNETGSQVAVLNNALGASSDKLITALAPAIKEVAVPAIIAMANTMTSVMNTLSGKSGNEADARARAADIGAHGATAIINRGLNGETISTADIQAAETAKKTLDDAVAAKQAEVEGNASAAGDAPATLSGFGRYIGRGLGAGLGYVTGEGSGFSDATKAKDEMAAKELEQMKEQQAKSAEALDRLHKTMAGAMTSGGTMKVEIVGDRTKTSGAQPATSGTAEPNASH